MAGFYVATVFLVAIVAFFACFSAKLSRQAEMRSQKKKIA